MNELKMITQEEAATLLNTTRQNISEMRDIGLIKAIKTGRCYMFSQDEIRRFQSVYRGLDVSNKVKAMEAYEFVQKKKADAGTSTSN